jgi:hypothetical protein
MDEEGGVRLRERGEGGRHAHEGIEEDRLIKEN